MSETRVVVTSEQLREQLTGNATAAPEVKPEKTGEAPKTGTEATEQPKKKPLIEELVRTRHERNDAKTENQQLRAELEELRQQMQANQALAPAKELDPRPTRAQFVSDDDYQEALTDWKVDQRLAERQQEDQQARVQATQAQLEANWTKRLTAAKETLTDFDEVVGKSDINLPNPIYAAIVESDLGPEISYYLAKNPDEVRLLTGMTLTAALRMLGKLEDRLEKEKEPSKESTTSTTKLATTVEKSKAPPPIEPLKNASTPVEQTGPMSYQDYKAQRQAQLKARQQR